MADVNHIDHQVHEHESQGDEEDDALSEGVFALEDRIDGQAAQAGQRKQGFDDDRTTEQVAELDAN